MKEEAAMLDIDPNRGPNREPDRGEVPEPILRPEARVAHTDRSLAAMVLMICTLGGMGLGFGFAMYLMRAELVLAPAGVATPPGSTWLGVGIRTVTDGTGSVVVRVYGDTAAAAAGVHAGDVVIAFDGQAVHDAEDLVNAVRTRAPGEVVPIALERDGKPVLVRARLGFK
jgi:membrane-associated protease RseP (regulator of RpoE activity)